jgi:hypothetical protein
MSAKAGPTKVVRVGVVENAKDEKTIAVQTYRQGNFTIAEAMVAFKTGKNGNAVVYRGMGAALRNHADRENQSIGERLAVARALGKLRTMIVSDTMTEVHTHGLQNGNPLTHLSPTDLSGLKEEITKEEKRRKKLEAEKAKKRAEYVGEK